MKSRFNVLGILSVFALLFPCSCVEKLSDDVEKGLPSELVVKIGPAPGTKADGPVSGENKMNSLIMFLVNTDDSKIYGYANSNKSGAVPDGMMRSDVLFSGENSTAEIRFEDVPSGGYVIYCLANPPQGFYGSHYADYYEKGISADNINPDGVQLPVLNGTDVPVLDLTNENGWYYPQGMPMSFMKKATLRYGSNSISGELVRIAGRFSVEIGALMEGYSLEVKELKFSDFNPSHCYIFPHAAADGGIQKPDGNTYRALPTQKTFPLTIGSGNVETCYDSYLYEGAAGEYSVTISADIHPLEKRYKYEFTDYTSYSAGKEYLLRNRRTSGYLYDDGMSTGPKMETGPVYGGTKNLENYLWTFSAGIGENCVITNVATGMSLRYDISTGSAAGDLYMAADRGDSDVFINGFTNSFLYMRARDRYRDGLWGNTYSFVGSDSSLTSGYAESVSSDNQLWTLQTAEVVEIPDPVASINKTIPLTKITENSDVLPVTEIRRNTHLKNKITVYYNPASGKFNFVVDAWAASNDNEITFD